MLIKIKYNFISFQEFFFTYNYIIFNSIITNSQAGF